MTDSIYTMVFDLSFFLRHATTFETVERGTEKIQMYNEALTRSLEHLDNSNSYQRDTISKEIAFINESGMSQSCKDAATIRLYKENWEFCCKQLLEKEKSVQIGINNERIRLIEQKIKTLTKKESTLKGFFDLFVFEPEVGPVKVKDIRMLASSYKKTNINCNNTIISLVEKIRDRCDQTKSTATEYYGIRIKQDGEDIELLANMP